MQDTITTMFCLCDDFLKANGCCDDRQCRVSTAQIMMTPLVACSFFGGNLALSRRFLVSHGYFPHDLSASRFCRRLHAISRELWHNLFRLLGEVFVRCNSTASYVVDSLPSGGLSAEWWTLCRFRLVTISASSTANCWQETTRNLIVAVSPVNAAFSLVSKCICSSPAKASRLSL